MYCQSEWKTLWILIRWLREKPPDQDLQCFQKRINQENILAESQVGGVLTFQVKYCQKDNGLPCYSVIFLQTDVNNDYVDFYLIISVLDLIYDREACLNVSR